MGVKTKVFGPYVWRMLEGVGAALDEVRQDPHRSRHEKNQLLDDVSEWFRLLTTVLPCIYCRRSFSQFDVDLDKTLRLHDGGKRWVYLVHRQVSMKLLRQAQDQASSEQEKRRIIRQKRDQMPSFEAMLEKRFDALNSPRWWEATIYALTLIMCDWRSSESRTLFRFFQLLAHILEVTTPPPVYQAYAHTLLRATPIWQPEMDLPTRISIVWSFYEAIWTVHHWKPTLTFQTLLQTGQQAIVGC